MQIVTRLGVAKKVGIFDLRSPKLKISYISPLLIYKKIFFSGHFDEIFISKVDFCKFWLVWGLRKKVVIFDLRTSKRKISYISGKGIYKKIFFSGHFDEIFVNKSQEIQERTGKMGLFLHFFQKIAILSWWSDFGSMQVTTKGIRSA